MSEDLNSFSKMKEHYKSLYKQHGNSVKSVQWRDQSSQYARFKILADIEYNIGSVIDIGCGLGDLYGYLLDTRNYQGSYLGLDFVNEFIEAAKKKYSNNTKSSFRDFDLKNDTIPKGYEYILLSGVFNNKMDGNKEFMLDGIRKMFDSCSKGIAFNALSTYVDYKDEHLYYSNPCEVFDFCKNELSRKITLRHDYLVKENSIPFEYTIYLYR